MRSKHNASILTAQVVQRRKSADHMRIILYVRFLLKQKRIMLYILSRFFFYICYLRNRFSCEDQDLLTVMNN